MSYLGMFTGLATFLVRFPGTNRTVMPLKLSNAPLHTDLDNTCETNICVLEKCKEKKNVEKNQNSQINRPFSSWLKV